MKMFRGAFVDASFVKSHGAVGFFVRSTAEQCSKAYFAKFSTFCSFHWHTT